MRSRFLRSCGHIILVYLQAFFYCMLLMGWLRLPSGDYGMSPFLLLLLGVPVLGVYLLYALVCYFLSRSIIPTGRMIKVVFIFSAVLDDIGGRRFTQKTKEGFDDAFENYDDWINTLTNNGTSYPDLNSRSNFNAEFMTHLNNFQKYGEPGYTNNSTILPNLNPEALKKYFNNTLNCNN